MLLIGRNCPKLIKMKSLFSTFHITKNVSGKSLIFLFAVLFSFVTLGADDQAKFLRPRGAAGKERISGLKWVIPRETTEIRSTGQNLFQVFAILRATLSNPSGRELIWNGNNIIPTASEDGVNDFSLSIPLNGERTKLSVEARGPNGEIEKEELMIVFKDWSRISQTLSKPKKIVFKRKRNFLTPALGISRITYSETSYSSFTQIETTASLSYKHNLNSRWNLTAGGFSTVLPVSSTLSGTTASFRGLNAATEYLIPFANDAWSIFLSTGLNYRSMSSSKDTFGYSPIIYPHFTPGFKKVFGIGNVLSGYVKYGALGAGLSPWSSSEYEIGGGLAWEHSLSSGKVFSIRAEHSNVSFKPDETTDIEIQSTNLFFGLSF